VPPAAWTILTVSSAGSTVTSQPTTDAPSRANVRAAFSSAVAARMAVTQVNGPHQIQVIPRFSR
jgi:hypothetical protein